MNPLAIVGLLVTGVLGSLFVSWMWKEPSSKTIEEVALPTAREQQASEELEEAEKHLHKARTLVGRA